LKFKIHILSALLLFIGCSYNNNATFNYNAKYDKNYIDIRFGNVPIIFTIPHSGSICLSDIPIRDNDNKNNCSFNLKNDLYVDIIVNKFSDELNNLTGNVPYVIQNNIHRKYIDVNRNKECAYSHNVTEFTYDRYHSYINGLINHLTMLYDKVLLIDLHGQYSHTGDIFIGTDNGTTIDDVIELKVINSFIDMGYVTTDEHWHGGYTIKNYGKHNDKVDAIQIEIDKKYRFDEKMMDKFVTDFVFIINDIHN
tara:strand:+ start:66 stop:821 length:756 start_codon:yes stop_codon:yes gene_type:complete